METKDLRTVPGFGGMYSVTADGRVWSVRLQRFLNPSRHSQGYREVRVTQDGVKKTVLVHRLVALAWVPNPCPESWKCVNHLNGDKTDNRVENLEWCDHGMNQRHAVATGLNKPTDAHREAARRMGLATRSLSEDQVREMRQRHASGQTVVSIAREFSIPRTTASAVVHRHNYSSIV